MEVANAFCGRCGSFAQMFCPCTTPETFLCENCVIKHLSEKPGLQHSPKPLAEFTYYTIPHYYEHFDKRMRNLHRIKDETRTNVLKFDDVIEEFTQKIQGFVTDLTTYAEKVVKELKEMKGKMERDTEIALEEVEKTLREENPELNSEYGPLLRKLVETSSSLELFTCTVLSTPVPAQNSLISLETHLASMQDLKPVFASVYGKNAILYDVESQTVTTHPLTMDFGWGGSYQQVNSNSLLCVGADPASTAVFDLDLTFFQLTPLPCLNTPRKGTGIVKVGPYIYVFGGKNAYDEHLRSSEKMHLLDKHWSPVRSQMTYPRSWFTPCLHHSLIYLLCALKITSRTVEVFSTIEETFTLLPIQLPMEMSIGTFTGSVAFIVEDELCLLTDKKQIIRWKVGGEDLIRCGYSGKGTWSTQQPLRCGENIMIAYNGTVQVFNLNTFSFAK